ncbi:MAG: Gfo/Idh/MocA family oxidoreductase [Flavobacteriaceae bacterium]|nr:Gfo/Idh/MocA family oxidoreductase [Flavobacteriaceae bacterium]MCY4254174.1 Gfo/Idh/MocA family oxidoreductase [Flavobacteriaceae bacterium]
MNRKEFIKQSSLVIGLATVGPTTLNFANHSIDVLGANDQIRIGTIGINGMGWTNTLSLLKIPNVELVAICDVDQNIIHPKVDSIKGKLNTLDVYNDYRDLLNRNDIDVVVIGTPDHWHALMMIHSLQAGKHVYVEKPLGNSIGECDAMVKAQKKYQKVVQVGQWQRSQAHFNNALNFIDSGLLGNIRTVKVWCYQGWMRPASRVPDSEPPNGVDYQQWLGPAPRKAFNSSRFHFHFRWFWDYAGGLMTDWGVHLLDYALLGMKATQPKSIVGLGGHFAYPDMAQETPDTLTTLYEFDAFNLVWDSAMGIDLGSYGLDHGIAFIGNHGTLVLNRSGWKVIEEPNSINNVKLQLQSPLENGLDAHTKNFIGAIRNNSPDAVNCSVQEAAHIAILAQMGNISYQTDKKLFWNKEKMEFTDPDVNEKYFTTQYHNGYELPQIF